MAKRDIIVIEASAGGVQALRDLVKSVPLNFNASVFIILHTAPYSPGYLAEIALRSRGMACISNYFRNSVQKDYYL